MKKSDNLLDYIRWRGDLSFTVVPLNDIDNVILSILSYIDYSDISAKRENIKDICEKAVPFSEVMDLIEEVYPKRKYLGAILPDEIIEIAFAAAMSERFSAMRLNCYENVIDESLNIQFSATTFILPDETIFISYRGTDDTLVGWKEDFYMAFESPVPSQIKALEYLIDIATKTNLPIRLGGHSKGGNLAVWSAVKCSSDIKKRIINAYSNDGPGFSCDFYETDECKQIADRLIKIIPDSSVVGLLLEESSNYKIVKSTQKTLLQHNPLSWQVDITSFTSVQDTSQFSKKSDKVLKEWLSSMSGEERHRFVDAVFGALTAGNAKTLTDINNSRMRSAVTIAHSMKNMDRESRKKLIEVFRMLLTCINKK